MPVVFCLYDLCGCLFLCFTFQVDRIIYQWLKNQTRVSGLRQEDVSRGGLLHHLPERDFSGVCLQIPVSGRWAQCRNFPSFPTIYIALGILFTHLQRKRKKKLKYVQNKPYTNVWTMFDSKIYFCLLPSLLDLCIKVLRENSNTPAANKVVKW